MPVGTGINLLYGVQKQAITDINIKLKLKPISMKRVLQLVTVISLGAILFTGCSDMINKEKNGPNMEEYFAIANIEYSKLARTTLVNLQSFDFDKWGESFSEDVTIYFPDGGPKTRTIIEGKDNMVKFYKDWSQSSGIKSLGFEEVVFIPVNALKPLNYSHLTGPLVVVYCSVKYNYSGKEFYIRSNYVFHFDENKKIDHWFMYYDRTPIIDATYTNILKREAEIERQNGKTEEEAVE